MNITHIIVVGLVSGAVTVGVGYLLLAKLADFQWWWLIALFGAQFLSVILAIYVLDKQCIATTKTQANNPTMAWDNLCKPTIQAAKVVATVPVNDAASVNPEDWQALLKQLDQLSKEPAVPVVAVKTPVPVVDVCPPVSPTPAQPTPSPVVPTFDFSAIANVIATPALPAAVRISDTMPTKAPKIAPASASEIPSAPPQTIDFASLFR
ncbi:MAG: hypothetical protein AAB323_02020 [Pseudomonadota bacterium]